MMVKNERPIPHCVATMLLSSYAIITIIVNNN